MTEAELENLRLRMRLEAVYVLLRGLCTGLANTTPGAAKALRESFARLRKEHGKIALPNLPEGYSDMIAAEYQEALDDLLSFIEEGVRKG